MKSKLLLSVILMLPLLAQAQTASDSTGQKKWSIAIGAGFGTTWREKGNFLDANGLVLSIEPSYRLSSLVTLGARAEYVFIKDYLSGKDTGARVKAKAFPTLSLTGDISPWNGTIRPFAGIGAGLYFLGTATEASAGAASSTDLETRFGVSPRVGVAFGNVSALVEVHVIDEETLYNRDYATLKLRYSF